MRNASIGKLRLRPLRKCSGAWKRVKTVDWNPSDAHQTSGVRHITVANLRFDPISGLTHFGPQRWSTDLAPVAVPICTLSCLLSVRSSA